MIVLVRERATAFGMGSAPLTVTPSMAAFRKSTWPATPKQPDRPKRPN